MMNQKIASSHMGLVCVAILTGKVTFRSRYGHTATRDHVVASFVTILALEIHSLSTDAHMNVKITGGLLEGRTHIAVFDGIAAPTKEMAVHAAGGPAWPSHVLGNFYQIHPFFGKACPGWCFLIGLSSVMADQAIDFSHISKIKVFIFPAVANVTAGAPGPVAAQIDAEIVDGEVAFPQISAFFMPHRIR